LPAVKVIENRNFRNAVWYYTVTCAWAKQSCLHTMLKLSSVILPAVGKVAQRLQINLFQQWR